MELTTKPAYKQTEVGLIPQDWDALELNEFGATGRPVIKAGPFGSSLKKEFYVSEGYKIYGQEQVIKNDPFYGDYFIDKERYRKLKSCKVLPGDILLSLVGTFGKVLVIPEKALKGIINPRLLRISVDRNKFHTKYISYFLRSTKAIGILESKLQGGTMGVLNASILKSFQIPLPPTLTEQKAIATALSDVDALIASLEQTITKKKAIKQGAMQQLLTPPHKGGKRLPGFSGEWVERTLGEVINLDKGEQLNKDTLSLDGEYPVINGGIEPSGYCEKWNRVENTIAISEGGNSCGFVNLLKTKFWSGGHCYTLKLKTSEVNQQYLYLFLKYMENSIMSLRVGSGLPNIQKGRLMLFNCTLPIDIVEQKAIAQTLSDMDAEITQLDSKKAKYQAIKQGMMQELLTGKTRLV